MRFALQIAMPTESRQFFFFSTNAFLLFVKKKKRAIRNLFNCWAKADVAWTISDCGLNTSPKLRAYTPVLLNSSFMRVLTVPRLRTSFGLRCFQPLSITAWLLSLPYRTTDALEAAGPCSSRTKGLFPSDTERFQKRKTNLSHDGLNPSHDPF